MEDYKFDRNSIGPRGIKAFREFERTSRNDDDVLLAKVNCIDGRHVLQLYRGRITPLSHSLDPDHELSREGIETMQLLAIAGGGEPLRCRCFEAITAWRWFTSEYPTGVSFWQLRDEIPWLQTALYKRITDSGQITPTHFLSLIPKDFHDAAREARDRSVYRTSLGFRPYRLELGEKDRNLTITERYSGSYALRAALKELVEKKLLPATGHEPGQDHNYLPFPQDNREWLRHVWRAPWFRVFADALFAPIRYPLFEHWKEHNGIPYPEFGRCFRFDKEATKWGDARYPRFWFRIEPRDSEWDIHVLPLEPGNDPHFFSSSFTPQQ